MTDPIAEGVVYVVDDDTELREYIRYLLAASGWRIETFADPLEFLEAYKDAGVACVVTDVCMPGLSGLELQRELAGRGIDLPVIMISAYAEVPTAVSAMRQGAVDFLEKPFEAQALLDRVREALAASQRAAPERDGARRGGNPVRPADAAPARRARRTDAGQAQQDHRRRSRRQPAHRRRASFPPDAEPRRQLVARPVPPRGAGAGTASAGTGALKSAEEKREDSR